MPAEEHWKSCPPGELNRLGMRLRGRRRQQQVVRSTAALAAVLLLGLGLWTLRPGPTEYHFAGISCSKVQDLAMAYANQDLETDLTDQVESHVEQCPHCQERFKAMGLLSILIPPELANWSRVLLTGIRGGKAPPSA